MNFNTEKNVAQLTAMKTTVSADTSDWRSTLVARYIAFLTTKLNQRQANLNALMARTSLPSDVMTMRTAYQATEQAAIDATTAALPSTAVNVDDQIAAEAMLRLYVQAGGM